MMNSNLLCRFGEIPWKFSQNLLKIKGCRNCASSNENKIILLKELTGCSYEMASKTIKYKKTIDKVDEERIKKTHSILQDFSISNDDIVKNLNIIMIHPVTLQNHYLMFKEAGFKKSKINCYALTRFYKIFKTSVNSLKSRGFIDVNTNVSDNYSKVLRLPSHFHRKFEDSAYLPHIHITNLHGLLRWKSEGIWDYSEIPRRLNYKSVQIVARLFDLLTEEFGLSKDRICKFPEFLTMSHDNLENILKHVPTLSGHDVREVVKRWPKILYTDYKALIEIDKYLQEYELSNDAILNYPALFTLKPENVYNRLKNVAQDPDFVQWMYHPNFLSTIMYYNKFTERINKLRDANIKCVSLFLLNAPEKEFNRHVEHLDKSNQYDLLTFLSLKLPEDQKSIRKRLQKHPYWLYIPHKDVQETLLFLLNEGFNEEEILSSIIILLYPKSVLQNELSKLNSEPLFNCCRNPENGELRRKTILPLLLYSIELPFHFSKDAIWAYKNKVTNISKSSGYLPP